MKITLTLLAVFLIFWLAGNAYYTGRHAEFREIVQALGDSDQLGDCLVEVDVNRPWFRFWTPNSVEIEVSHGDTLLRSKASVYQIPDRLQLGPMRYRYDFPWSERNGSGERMEYTFMTLDMRKAWNREPASLHGLEVTTCDGPDESYSVPMSAELCEDIPQTILCRVNTSGQ